MDYYRFIKNPLILFTILFWIVQLLINLMKADNLLIISLIDFLLVTYFLLWFSIGKFKKKSKQFYDGLISPIFILLIFLFIPSLINLTCGEIFSGILWRYSWLLFGNLPLLVATIYIIYTIAKDGSFNDSFFKKRGEQFSKYNSRSFAISFCIVFLIILSPIIVNGFNFLIGDNEADLHQLVDDITKDSENNTDKTLALLAWFDRGEGKSENISNIYYRERESDNEILLNIGNSMYIFSKPPHFCTRGDDAMWIFSSLCGRCGEFGTLFNTMAYYANLTVRKVVCNGEDHVWNEVKIEGEWLVVDATAVNLPDKTGFNLSSNFMENKVRGEWKDGRTQGNVSYVYAIYPNATSEEVDITCRYTDTVNITIKTVDVNNQSISGVTIKVYSLNSANPSNYDEYILSRKTNEIGQYTFRLGDGEYKFKVEKGSLEGVLIDTFTKDKNYYNRNITLSK